MKKNKKTTTIVWIFQATTTSNLKQEDLDMVKKEEP